MLFISLKTMDNNFQLDTKPEPPDLTPLIDVIFILIVFFLLTSSIQDKIIEIDLPGSTEAENDKIKNELVIEIDRDNIYYIDGRQTDFTSVSLMVKIESEEKNSPFITVRSDRETDFSSIVKLLDLAKRYRIKGINFSVETE